MANRLEGKAIKLSSVTCCLSFMFTVNYQSNRITVVVMQKYIMWGTYCDDVLEKRTPYRQAHLDGLAKQKESGVLITIGPTKDVTKVFGIYEAEDEATVRQLIENDPYWQNGIWTEYFVKEWIQAM
jgi:uncharacterized protein YciI